MKKTEYRHHSGSDTVTVTASEDWSIAMCKKLKEDYPNEVHIEQTNEDGSMVVQIPFGWILIDPVG